MQQVFLFSFFAGAGFLDLGFEQEGFPVVFVNEKVSEFLRAYKFSRKQMGLCVPQHGYSETDVIEFVESDKREELSDLVMEVRKNGIVGFIAGPPCPDFSSGGRHEGRNGSKGKLTGTYVDILIQQQPDFFLFENVKGLWKTAKHREYYDEMKTKLQDSPAEYILGDRLLNALEFGVPQDRDRIILVGFRREILDSLDLPYDLENRQLLDDSFDWYGSPTIQQTLEQIKSMGWPTQEPFVEGGSHPFEYDVPKELTIQHWFDTNKVTTHPNAGHFFRPKSMKKFRNIQEGNISGKSFKRLHRWRYSPTAAYGNNEVHLHPYQVRRISVAEALAIQSLPPAYELPSDMTLSNMFKVIGNGVPYLMSQSLARSVRKFLKLE